MNETKDKEPLVTHKSVIIAPRCFKLFKCGGKFLGKIDATCERACTETPKERHDTEVIKYQQACIPELKENYYTELSFTITNFNDSINMPLSNLNIREAVLRVMIADEEGYITDSNNVTSETFSHASSLQRENPNAIFTSESLEKSDELVNAVKSITINDAGFWRQ